MFIPRKRKGLSLMEVVIALAIIAFAAGVILMTTAAMSKAVERTNHYLQLNAYIANVLDIIKTDIKDGVDIESLDSYDDAGNESGIIANVNITRVGNIFGKPTYLVVVRARFSRTTNIVLSRTILRANEAIDLPYVPEP